jgi:dipeptidyl aminopeptidase/acylaminoacyl peptidase
MRARGLAWAAVALVAAAPAFGVQAPERGTLALEEIMRGREFVGFSPSRPRWTPDGRWLTFVWRAPGDSAEALYRVPRAGGRPERLGPEVAARLEPTLHAVRSKDGRWAAYADRGDVVLLDLRSGRARVVSADPEPARHVQVAPDGSRVYFVRGDNLYVADPVAGSVRRLTDIRRGDPPKREPEPQGQRAFLREQQRELFGVFREDSLRRARAYPPPPDTAGRPKPFYVERDATLGGFGVSPDGRRMWLEWERPASEARLAWVPDYVTESGYTEQAPGKRTKVGDAVPAQRLAWVDLATGDVAWVDPGLEGRRVRMWPRGWSPDGGALLVVAVADDFKDRWVLVVDVEADTAFAVDHARDEAWIGGPLWNAAGWMPDGRRIWFVSEASGFAHLYTVPVGGGAATPLTSGPWEVTEVELDEDAGLFRLQTSEASPFERHLYTMPLGGGERRRLTEAVGRHDGVWSPDGARIAVLHSTANRPPELYLQDARPGARPQRLTESTTPAFRAYDWRVPEIVTFRASDGTDVPARLYRPERPNGAAVVFVHGAGYLQNVHRWWSSYEREYMFHNLLADRGYTVLDIDYRGSAGYGRDWRTAVYRHMGGRDLQDQVDGARYLVREHGVDPARIGIYGGSYGGFLTLMAMFTEPEVFAAGAALRPVTDWAHYNHGYTGRILNLPQDDPEAYRRSSPIYFAEGLRGALLICHGMVDQNVHFQDTVRLVQRLIELGKTGWEVAIYPVEDHGFRHASSWTDEYRRVLALFERHLGPGGPGAGGGR